MNTQDKNAEPIRIKIKNRASRNYIMLVYEEVGKNLLVTLKRLYGIDFCDVLLCGSCARGENISNESDLDLLFVSLNNIVLPSAFSLKPAAFLELNIGDVFSKIDVAFCNKNISDHRKDLHYLIRKGDSVSLLSREQECGLTIEKQALMRLLNRQIAQQSNFSMKHTTAALRKMTLRRKQGKLLLLHDVFDFSAKETMANYLKFGLDVCG